MLSSLSAGTPRPSSMTLTVTPSEARTVTTRTVERGGENLTALLSRLVSTWSRRSESIAAELDGDRVDGAGLGPGFNRGQGIPPRDAKAEDNCGRLCL